MGKKNKQILHERSKLDSCLSPQASKKAIKPTNNSENIEFAENKTINLFARQKEKNIKTKKIIKTPKFEQKKLTEKNPQNFENKHQIQQANKGKPWSQLQYKLRDQIQHSLKKCNFKTMMPVQEACIPLLLKNYDLAVEAQTGSGKTLAFLVPLLQKYLAISVKKASNGNDEDNEENQIKTAIKYLVISPTRQLCQQTFSVLTKLLENLPSIERSKQYLKYCHCATGGSDMAQDIKKLRESTFVFIGTVGRIRQLSEHMEQNWLKKIEYLYIDEADRVLKQNGIENVIRSIQKIRRTAMFSATLQTLQPKNYEFYGMRNLAKISLKQSTQNQSVSKNTNVSTNASNQNQNKNYIIPKSLTNTYVKFPSRLQKIEFLVNFLIEHIQKQKIIVFFNTCCTVDFYTKLFNTYLKNLLDKTGEQIVGLHGKLKNKKRQKLIKAFLAQKSGCLFATDVVSRGIDFDFVHYIIQIDPPEDPDNYVHRIGRTARINRPGTAILMIEGHQQAFINYLSDKSVGVQEITNFSAYYDQSKKVGIQKINNEMEEIMKTDRDYVQKSKKAFVSYIRSYKQHDLRYIFQFKNIDIGLIAHSFFMFRIPRIKQILGKPITSFTQSQLDIQLIPWLDKNQQKQFELKREKRLQQEAENKILLKKKLASNVDVKNNKSKRKRIKAKLENLRQESINKDHREFLKQKRNIGSKKYEFDEQDSQDNFVNEDTEEIQKRMLQENQVSPKVNKKKIKKNNKRK